MFEESSKQARRCYVLVATVAIAVGLFVLTAKTPEDLYEKAYAQVATALSIDWQAYEDYLEETLQTLAERRYRNNLSKFYAYMALDLNRATRLDHSSYREYADRRILSRKALFDHLMQSSDYRVYGGDFKGMEHAEIAFRINPGHAIRAYTFDGYQRARNDDREPYELTPVDIVRLATSPVGRTDAAIVVADPPAVSKAVTAQARARSTITARGSPTRAKVSGIVVEGYARLSSTDLIDLNVQSDQMPSVAIDIRFETRPLGESGQIPAKWQSDNQIITIGAKVIKAPGTSLAAWLGKNWPELGAVRDGLIRPFAGLGHVWPTIADRSLLDAELYLAAGLSAEKAATPKVNLGGVELPASLVPLAGPIVLAALIFQLARFLRYVVDWAGQNTKSLAELPWLLIHSRFGHLEAAFVVIILPIVIQGLITWRTPSISPAVLVTGWFAIGVGALAGFRVFLFIVELRKMNPRLTETQFP